MADVEAQLSTSTYVAESPSSSSSSPSLHHRRQNNNNDEDDNSNNNINGSISSVASRTNGGGASSSFMFKKANRPLTLKFEDVVYKIKIKTPPTSTTSVSGGGLLPIFKKTPKLEERTILKGVTGIVKPGEMLAMLGPSGSGKTTLLTALGGRLGGRGLSGTVTYNNSPFTTNLKRSIGFVTQDDILYEHLTVTETLLYTALLRLPNTLSKDEKAAQAEAVVAQLGLGRCKDSMVGGPSVRGVSGGERKRVSIGQEMLVNPSLLFLDEPTSGLDSTTAQRIVSTLAGLAGGGRTVVMTIHQPSSRLFYMFSKVLLLSEGNPLYFGSGDRIMQYFDSVGFAPSVAMNPADFLLDLANGISPDDESEKDPAVVKNRLVTSYREHLHSKVTSEILQQQQQEEQQVEDTVEAGSSSSSSDHRSNNKKMEVDKWSTTWWQQFSVLLQRGIRERKHESFSGLKISQVLVIAILTGLLWFRSDISRLQDQVGLLFFYTGFWGFYPLFQAIFTFPPERLILSKERSSGMYRLSSYFIARIVGDLPMELVLPTGFLIIVYWMTGLKPTAGAFFYNLFALLLSVLVSQGIGLALGAVFLDQKNATVLGSVLMLAFLLAGGFYVQHVPGFVSWIKYLSVMQYTFKLMMGSQYAMDQRYPCGGGSIHDRDGNGCFVKDFPSVKSVGLDGQMTSVIALVIMLVGYRLIAYIALMRIGAPPK